MIACTAYWLLLAETEIFNHDACSKVFINLPCVTTKTCGTKRRASEADSNTFTNDEAGSLLEFTAEFWGSLSYCVAYIKFESTEHPGLNGSVETHSNA